MIILKKLNEEKHVKTKEQAESYIQEGFAIVGEKEEKQKPVPEETFAIVGEKEEKQEPVPKEIKKHSIKKTGEEA